MAGPKGRGYEVMAVFLLFLSLTTVTCALRVYCRACMQKAFGWDDKLAVFAWVCLTVFAALTVEGVFHGTGQHNSEIRPASDVPVALKYWWLCEPVYIIANMSIKASVGIMLLRLTVARIQRYILYINIAITEVYSLVFFFIFLFQCHPSSYFWERAGNPDAKGSCMDPQVVVAVSYGYAVVTCVTDIAFDF